MMITQNLLTCSSLFILSLHFLPLSHADSYCIPSACGIIRHISSPFRLRGDPKHCGDRHYELVCEDNVTSVYFKSHKYHVKAINYHDFTIRLADVSMNTSSCSIPMFSKIFEYYNSDADWLFNPYSLDGRGFITFMSCPDLLNISSLLIRLPDCENALSSSDGSGRHTYMEVGTSMEYVVRYMCTIDFVVPTSWNFTDLNNVSLSEIHQSLLYGFELSWFRSYICRNCTGRNQCWRYPDGLIVCHKFPSHLYYKWDHIMEYFRPPLGPTTGCLVIFLLIVAVLFAGLIIPAKIIIGLGAFYWVLVKNWYPKDIKRIIVVSFEVRFILGILCAMGFLIYTFRRRHLSMYEAIEGFLQSDNKLAPIKYSYSDLKRMTRGFREKLGEGGFGSVYKGKLRSGHDVAVKILRNPRENDKDFMNEIATIGRIHHVNVVKLVGYCAERSKRALVFDFMPNGSLDKYIFGREEANCLDLEMKFKIAIGVARGIEYLHCGCDIQILHFDIKPHNILLDDKFVAKISDFGLAKLCSVEKDSVTLTAARGTIGYVAPELINRSIGRVSYKADVYSFGMLLMEMVGLNRDLKGNTDDSSKYFPHWIYDQFNQGRDIEIGKAEKDINASDGNDNTRRLVRKMTIVALWCIQMSPDVRPSMNKVLQMLEGEVERLRIPDYPSQSQHIEDENWGTCSSDDSVSLLHSNNGGSLEIRIEDLQSLQSSSSSRASGLCCFTACSPLF